jgi:hypothetical protein
MGDIAAHVHDSISIGSVRSGRDGFDLIINLSGHHYVAPNMIMVLMDDVEITTHNVAYILKQLQMCAKILQAHKYHKILVHCAAGVNRSALVIGYYLLTCGISYETMIELLSCANKGRGLPVFTNVSFARLLRTYYDLIIHTSGPGHPSPSPLHT